MKRLKNDIKELHNSFLSSLKIWLTFQTAFLEESTFLLIDESF